MEELAFYRQVALATMGSHLDALLKGALGAAAQLTGAMRGAVVVAGLGGEPILRVQHPDTGDPRDGDAPSLSGSILREVLDTGRCLLLENALDEPCYAAVGRGGSSPDGAG